MKNKSLVTKRFGLQKYVFDKTIIRVSLIFCLLIFVIAAQENGGFKPKVYLSCKGPAPCANPYYDKMQPLTNEEFAKLNLPSQLRNIPILNPGFEINKPGFFVANGDLLIFLILISGFVVNHFLHNRKFSFYLMLRDRL